MFNKEMKMKQVRCRSGITGWQCRLQENYADYEQFEAYNDIYALIDRLGFNSAQDAWRANPVIQGSVNPADFRTV
jgi:hypothetical protein